MRRNTVWVFLRSPGEGTDQLGWRANPNLAHQPFRPGQSSASAGLWVGQGGGEYHPERNPHGATEDVLQVRQLCASMRNRFGQSVPLLACVGRYVLPAIRPLLETDLQGLIITPFDASEFRAEMDQMELGC